ncbi:MCE family protein [Saccharomonospora iraqiensis]|uniref:MCE family protein n=1 Tax=Saccharomonospora iraqiensis TaxID=52698 RepID=UPI00022E5A44|nr:MCE family protein [Saccharomonospora iraqiensis]
MTAPTTLAARIRRLRARGPAVDGAVGALVLALVVGLAVTAPRLAFVADTRAYTVEFAGAAGLSEGDRVLVAGVPTGEVTDITLAGDVVRIGFRLDRGQRLGDATTAAVKLATVLGTRYLAVTPAGSGLLPGDGTIPEDRTTVPYSLDDLAGDAVDTGNALDTDSIRRAVGALARSAPDGEVVRDALEGVGRASALIGDRQEEIDTLLSGVRSLTASLAGQQDTLAGLLRDAGTVAEVLHSRRDTIRALLDDVTALTEALHGVVVDNEPVLDALLSDLHTITGTLRRGSEEISETLRMLGPGSRYLADATGNGPWGDVAGPAGPLPDNLLCVAGLIEGCR